MAGQSTFDRVLASMGKPPESAIANVAAAYSAGKMTPEEAAQFEADVKSGRVMLPRGVSLKAPTAGAPVKGAPVLPAGVLAAYNEGRMAPADRAQLEEDLRAGLVTMPQGVAIPYQPQANTVPPAGPAMPDPNAPPPSLVDRVIGAGEAGLTAVTGATGGAVGMVGGALGGLAGSLASGEFGTDQGARSVADAAAQGAQALTYAPRTAQGQSQAAALGEIAQQLLPVAPLTAQVAGLTAAARPVAAAAGDATRAGAAAVQQAAQRGTQAVAQRVQAMRQPAAAATPGTLGSMGAAGSDMAAQRIATAQSLPEPIKLTKGQATRDFEQLRFEGETAKDGNLGQPLRDRNAQQNAALAQNFERLIDESGAQAPNIIETGRSVNSTLVNAAAKRKAEYRAKYKAAEAAGQMEDPVSTAPLVQYLQENASMNAPELAGGSMGLAQRELVRLGGAQVVDGQLVPLELPLKRMELLRRQIGNAIDASPDNATNMRAGVQLRELIDTSTEGLGGNLYKEARQSRRRYAQLFEDNAIVRDLLRTRRGTADRQVALEDVFRRSVLNGDRASLSMLRRTLHIAGGEEGQQAWRELQGATFRHLLDEATKGVGTDIAGNPIFSAAKLNNAVRALDVDGRLEFLLTKKGAQTVRDLNEISKVVLTLPPGAVNTSNTAGVLLTALAEAGAWGGMTGMPIPVLQGLKALSGHMKDRRVRARVDEALRAGTAAEAKKRGRPGPMPKSAPQSQPRPM